MVSNSRRNHSRLSLAIFALAMTIATLFAQSRPQSGLPKPFESSSAMNFPKVIGWPAGKMPIVPKGFVVDALATDIESPRWLLVLPNGDVLVSQSKTTKPAKDDPEAVKALTEAGSLGVSPNQITLLRDANKDGRYEIKQIFIAGLNQPFGMALRQGFLYVANTDSIMRFPYKDGATSIDVRGEKILDLPAGGYNNHWTRNILFSPSGDKLYITVGSQTNVDEEGLDAKEPRRAAILECNPDGSGLRIFASGLRNPNGMDWSPADGALWTVVNERDELGDDVPPDFLTSVRDGGFYGWPYAYFGIEDPRHKGERPDLVSKAIVPDVAVGAHTATLGLVFYRDSSFPARYRNGAFIGQHGSWNRSKFSGYRVAFVPLHAGAGTVEDFLTGFVASEERREVYGRPVGLAVLPGGALAVADDAGNRIWRVRSTGEVE
jgi:glucose/arabinose dehydrogenase